MRNKNLIIITFVIFIVIFSLAFVIGCYNFYVGKLQDFKVLEVVEQESSTLIYFEKNPYAVKYDIVVTDEDDNIIYTKTVKEPVAKLEEVPAIYGEEVKVSVVAYNRKEESISSENDLSIIWMEPTFSKENELYALENIPFYLNIAGDFTKAKYELQLFYNDEIIYSELINSISIEIPYDKISKYSGRIVAKIIKNNEATVSTYNFYVNTVIIGQVDIVYPQDKTEYLIWDNIDFEFTGGANANKYILNIYEQKNNIEELSTSVTLNNFRQVIECDLFKELTYYRLELVALFNDYEEISKKTSIYIKTGRKETVDQIYATTNFLSVQKGDIINFKSDTKDVTLLYTLDGKDPLEHGVITDGNILIEENTLIKIAGIRYNMNDSLVSTFDIKVEEERQKVIYISPSNQHKNFGNIKAGYTTEKEMMNKVADVVSEKLQASDFKVLRNNDKTDIKAWTAESARASSDLHLAIHSNAAPYSKSGTVQGMEAYVYDENSLGFSIAKMLYNNLYAIYPFKNDVTDRGVLSALNNLGETHPGNVKVGVLLEIAFHDNYDDALWMVQNIEVIGNNIAQTIIDYYK